MCGIVAVLDASNASQRWGRDHLRSRLEASLECIDHRGPDARGIWVNEDATVGLGHVRLSINDLSDDGTQPLHSISGSIHAVIQGELYDYDALRADLTSQGVQFTSNSDSELVIGLYQIYGLSFFERLRGEFAFCLYDEDLNMFIACRDRYGIKPLFWYWDENRVAFAAEQKAFLGLGWEPEWDVESIREGGYLQDTRTFFRGVHKVQPGTYTICDTSRSDIGAFPITKRYWEANYPTRDFADPRGEAEMIDGVRDRLIEAVKIRLRADVPVGIYLSGGIDSSAIAGIVKKLVHEDGLRMGDRDPTSQISCFTIAFDANSGFDESASATAKHLDMQLHTLQMDESAFARDFEAATYHIEHTNSDLNFVGKYALSRLPRQHGCKVVLTGEGSDEHFGGYFHFLPDFLATQDPNGHDFDGVSRDDLKKNLSNAIDSLLKTPDCRPEDTEPSVTSKEFNQLLSPSYNLYFHAPVALPPQQLFRTSHCPSKGLDYRRHLSKAIDAQTKSKLRDEWHPLHGAFYLHNHTILPNFLLSSLGDRVEMAHALEARTPYLDHRLTEYVNNLPPSTKIRWGSTNTITGHDTRAMSSALLSGKTDGTFVEKYILREAVKPFVTKEVYERNKQFYTAPRGIIAGSPLHKLFERLITYDNVDRIGFIDPLRALHALDTLFEAAQSPIRVEKVDLRRAWISVMTVAQLVVLSQRFGVRRAGDR